MSIFTVCSYFYWSKGSECTDERINQNKVGQVIEISSRAGDKVVVKRSVRSSLSGQFVGDVHPEATLTCHKASIQKLVQLHCLFWLWCRQLKQLEKFKTVQVFKSCQLPDNISKRQKVWGRASARGSIFTAVYLQHTKSGNLLWQGVVVMWHGAFLTSGRKLSG